MRARVDEADSAAEGPDLRLMQHQLDHSPTRHLKRAALILVAVDIEPGLVLSSNPVFADVLLALDLHDHAQRQKRPPKRLPPR